MEENNNVSSNKKNAIVGLVAVVVIVLVIILGINVFGPSPKKTLKKYFKYMNEGDYAKAYELVDQEAAWVLAEIGDEDDYEDFNEELKDFRDSDEYEEYEDSMEDFEDTLEDMEDYMEDYEISFELEEFKSSKKVKGTKNLYKVKAKVDWSIESEYYDQGDKETLTFYMVKNGGKYYIATGGLDDLMY